MDMSFLIKSMLPPGVTVELLQAEGKILLEKIALAAQCIQATHALVLEQNAMLRQVIEQSQGLDPLTQQKDSHVDQTHATAVKVPEPDGQPIGQCQPLSGSDDHANRYPGNVRAECDICGVGIGVKCGIAASGDCRNCSPESGFVGNNHDGS